MFYLLLGSFLSEFGQYLAIYTVPTFQLSFFFFFLSFVYLFLSSALGRIQKPLHQLRGNVTGAAAWWSQSRNISEGSNNALYQGYGSICSPSPANENK
jgi:hypothetical protein